MDKRRIILYILLLIFRRKSCERRFELWKCIESAQNRRIAAFRRLQSYQCFVFAIVLSVFAFKYSSAVPRNLWMHERSSAWWERIVNQCFEGRDWWENFRMSRDTFLYLCEELKPAIERQDSVLRRAIPVQQRVAIALWKLATNSEYRSIGHLFGVSRSSVCLIVKDVCQAIVELLLPKYIQVPTGNRL